MTVKASGEQTGGAFGLVESHIRAGSSPPLHVHHREDESFWVLAGNIRFRAHDWHVFQMNFGRGRLVLQMNFGLTGYVLQAKVNP